MGDPAGTQHQVQVGGVAGALARLVDHRLTDDGRQLVDDVVAVLAAEQDAAARTLVAYPPRRCAAHQLAHRAVGQVREVAFPGVDHGDTRPAGGGEHRSQRLDRPAQQGDVVAEALPEPARLEDAVRRRAPAGGCAGYLRMATRRAAGCSSSIAAKGTSTSRS
jgi:uncharacterized protein involved in copper resistance